MAVWIDAFGGRVGELDFLVMKDWWSSSTVVAERMSPRRGSFCS